MKMYGKTWTIRWYSWKLLGAIKNGILLRNSYMKMYGKTWTIRWYSWLTEKPELQPFILFCWLKTFNIISCFAVLQTLLSQRIIITAINTAHLWVRSVWIVHVLMLHFIISVAIFVYSDVVSSRTLQIKEGLNRLLCLAPYGVVNFEVSSC